MQTNLPIAEIRAALRTTLQGGRRVVITAPTGSGKSTQIPQYLLDDGLVQGTVLILQPRRLAARVLAERVAFERGEPVGEIVGYRTRFEHRGTSATRLWFVTAGMLSRMLLSDGALSGVGAVVFDEFHERSLVGDIGLALIRRLQSRRADLGIVVMSATLEAMPVCAYLEGCPHLHADGRLHDVQVTYAPRPVTGAVWDEAALAAAGLVRRGLEGDILVFMPGVFEIRRTVEACRRRVNGVEVFPLFGDLAPAAQHRVMTPGDTRRIIVATNIAETSLTIPRVRHVIDSGLAKVNRYDHSRGVNMLECVPISRQAAAQRGGRAGREGPGTCHRLWSKAEQQGKVSALPAEVHRVDLSEGVMLLAALGAGDPRKLEWLESPRHESLAQAAVLLRELGLLLQDEFQLTDLGVAVARIPTHPRLGRFLHDAGHAGCLAEAALAAAILTERPLFRGKTHFPVRAGLKSDLLALVELVQRAHAHRFEHSFCGRHDLNPGAARQVWHSSRHLLRNCRHLSCDGPQSSMNEEAFGRCVLAALPDRLACRRDAGTLVCDCADGATALLARESGCRDARLFVAGEIREAGGRGRAGKTLLSMVTEVDEDWLLELFPDDWEEIDETDWDARRRQVIRRIRTSCLGVVLERKELPDVDPERAADLLADQVSAGHLVLKGWTKEVDAWIERVRWTARIFPERGLLTYDDTDLALIYRDLCAGASSYRDIKNRPCLDVVRHALPWEDIQFVDAMAPPFVRLPSGWRMKIEYRPGQPPKGRARIQDLYDLQDTPRIAGGRTPVLLDILAPNMRTVQITDDLGRFWREIYPRARKRLAPRYTKHEWR